jgi:hypothetical protein
MTPPLHSIHITVTDLKQNVPVLASRLPLFRIFPTPCFTPLAAHASLLVYFPTYTESYKLDEAACTEPIPHFSTPEPSHGAP